MNGMESGVSVLSFGVLSYFLAKGVICPRYRMAPGRILAMSFLLSVMVLSRLDDIFVFVPFALVLGLSSAAWREAVKRLIFLCVVPTLLIGAYLVNALVVVCLQRLEVEEIAVSVDLGVTGDNFRQEVV